MFNVIFILTLKNQAIVLLNFNSTAMNRAFVMPININ